MILLDGKKISLERAVALKTQVALLTSVPKLIIVRVGDRADSASYIKRKVEYGELLGIATEVASFPSNVAQDELIGAVAAFNIDGSVGGIIVQLPLPEHLDAAAIIGAIDPKKDVDGLTATNVRALVAGESGIVPATPRGIVSLLAAYDIPVSGKKVSIVGRSLLVGKSTALYLANLDATVTLCHSKTVNLAAETRAADILIVAIGKPGFIGAEHVRPDQTVIDVGISPVDETIAGDVDFEAVKDIVGAISPVPGGVGPMTVISLFENLVSR